jgi:hypothetical protein
MKRGWMILKMVTLGLIAVAAFTWATMLLWNWLVPTLVNGPMSGYWQALGLLALSKILFSGFGKKHGGGHWKHGGYWRSHLYQKMASMTPEEREAFKEKMREKWCRPSDQKKSKTENLGNNLESGSIR